MNVSCPEIKDFDVSQSENLNFDCKATLPLVEFRPSMLYSTKNFLLRDCPILTGEISTVSSKLPAFFSKNQNTIGKPNKKD